LLLLATHLNQRCTNGYTITAVSNPDTADPDTRRVGITATQVVGNARPIIGCLI
jgi:hypothetical protein